MEIANRLQQIMQERNLSQSDIVALCQPYCKAHGITFTKQAMSKYMQRNAMPTNERLNMLADSLHVSVGYLLGDEIPKLTDEEQRLIQAWRKSSAHEHELIGYILADYGFKLKEKAG